MQPVKILFISGLFAGVIFAADPFLGTWRLDRQKSKLPAQMATLKELVILIDTPSGGTLRFTSNATLNDGQTRHVVNTEILDGKDHPAKSRTTGKAIPGGTGTWQRPDEHHVNAVFKMNGKEAMTARDSVSQDGQTLTSVRRGSSPQGLPVDEVDIFERQQ